jgi:hypothetical protein
MGSYYRSNTKKECSENATVQLGQMADLLQSPSKWI